MGRDRAKLFKVQGWMGELTDSFSSGPLFSLSKQCPPIFCKPVGSKKELEAIQLLCLP